MALTHAVSCCAAEGVCNAGKFKQPVGQDTALQLIELQEILQSQDSRTVTSTSANGIISDAELRQLMDRSEDGVCVFVWGARGETTRSRPSTLSVRGGVVAVWGTRHACSVQHAPRRLSVQGGG